MTLHGCQHFFLGGGAWSHNNLLWGPLEVASGLASMMESYFLFTPVTSGCIQEFLYGPLATGSASMGAEPMNKEDLQCYCLRF